MKGPRFFPEALAEYQDAAAYYEMQSPSLGERLTRMVDEALALAMEFPLAGQLVEDAPAAYRLRQRMLGVFDIKIISCCAQRYADRGRRVPCTPPPRLLAR